METWKIYKHTNKINSKCYIGQTCRKNLNERWNNGKGYNGTVFAKAIEKYGWDNFDHEIIEDNILTQEKANEREQYWIEYYSSYGENGYNMTRGGDDRSDKGRPVYQIEMGTLQIVAEYSSTLAASRETGIAGVYQCCNRDMNNPATRSYSSVGGYYWCFAEDWSKDWKPKQYFDHQVCQIDEDGNLIKIWKSASEAKRELEIECSNILRCCKGQQNSAGNYYWCYRKDFENFKIPVKEVSKKTWRPVLCVETGQVFDKMRDADKFAGVRIIWAIDKLNKTAGGYHWKYINKDED